MLNRIEEEGQRADSGGRKHPEDDAWNISHSLAHRSFSLCWPVKSAFEKGWPRWARVWAAGDLTEEIAEIPHSPERSLGTGGGGGFYVEVPSCPGKAWAAVPGFPEL